MAAYRSRSAKVEAEATDELRRRWQAEATAVAGPPSAWIARLRTSRYWTKREVELGQYGLQPTTDLVAADTIRELEKRHSTWGRSDVIEALSVVLSPKLAWSADGMRKVLEEGADVVLASADVARLSGSGHHGGQRYTTWWTLKVEQAVLDIVETGRQAGVGIVPTEGSLAGLGDDQTDAVQRLCSGGERVAVLIGPAGCGKTRTLSAARQAW
jgi:hypothetical protein